VIASPGPDGATCATCRFWGGRPDGIGHKRGSPFPCRRHAPYPAHGQGIGYATAHTPFHYWCGDHQPITRENDQ
jgi:hypothetical protein